MSFYANLNALMDYIDAHLDVELNYPHLARQVGLSADTLQRIFPLLAGVTLSEYQRKRRLTLAGKDLAQQSLRVIDVALKYGYESAAAFARAFEKFHGLKPSLVRSAPSHLKYYPKLVFSPPNLDTELDYEIVELDSFLLYGINIETDNAHIRIDAPQLFCDIAKAYPERPQPDYGMVSYIDGRESVWRYRYWVLWKQPYADCMVHQVPASRWLKFQIGSQNAKDIQRTSDHFFGKFLPTCCYELRPDPELEYYHDGITELLVPIF